MSWRTIFMKERIKNGVYRGKITVGIFKQECAIVALCVSQARHLFKETIPGDVQEPMIGDLEKPYPVFSWGTGGRCSEIPENHHTHHKQA
jgi:hypothetical protein